MAARDPRDAVITGIGLVSALADGVGDHYRLLNGNERAKPLLDTESYAPYSFHPLVEIDLGTQIPRRGDQRQMENWQRYGTYGAGLALDDAGIKGDEEVLGRTNLIVAAGGGERDPEVDSTIADGIDAAGNRGAFLNEHLMNDLRPTLFLAQLSNLLAGNISLVHHVIGSSRTFMGEELGGAMALDRAHRQIRANQGDIFLVGAANNAGRPDMLLYLALGDCLWSGADVPSVWQRGGQPGGVVSGSMAAFLVIESRAHAEARGARIYAQLDGVIADRGPRDDAQKREKRLNRQRAFLEAKTGNAPIGVISAASGARDAMELERAFLTQLSEERPMAIRGASTVLGHGIEAQMPSSVALAAAALEKGTFFPPFDDSGFEDPIPAPPDVIAVSMWGYWRGEALAIIRAER